MTGDKEFVFNERYFQAVGFTMVSFLMVMAGINYLDTAYGFLGINQNCYQLAKMFVCVILALCSAIGVSKGLVAESMLMLVTMISCSSYVVSYFIGNSPSSIQDPFLSTIIFLIAFFFFRRKDLYLALATFIFGLSLLVPLFLEGDSLSAVLGIGLLIGGILYGVYSSAIITEGETGKVIMSLGSVFRHRSIRGIAVNPYETGVPICSMFTGLLLLFMSTFFITGTEMTRGDMVAVCMFMFITCTMAFYLSLRNVLSEGLFFLLISIDMIVQFVPVLLSMGSLPLQMNLVILLPVLFIAILCYKRKDPVFGTAVLLYFFCVLINLLSSHYLETQNLGLLYGAIEVLDGFLLLYHGLSRWLLIAVRREVLPLFTGNVVRREVDLNPGTAFVRRRHNWHITSVATDLGQLFLAILLLWMAVYYLDRVYGFMHVGYYSYVSSKLVLTFVVTLFAVLSVGRGAVTESIVFMLIGLSCFDFSALNMLGMEGLEWADCVLAVFLVICGIFYLKRDHPVMGTATICYAAGCFLIAVLHGDDGLVALGVASFISGTLFGVSSVRRFLLSVLVKRIVIAEDRSEDIRGLSSDTHETIVTLGYITLAVDLMLQCLLPYGSQCSVYGFIHSLVVVILGLYAIDRKYIAEGFSLILPGLMLMMNAACNFLFNDDIPSMFWIFMSLMMIPAIIVFVYNGYRMSAISNFILMIGFFNYGLFYDYISYPIVMLGALIIDYNALETWCVVEFRRHVLPALKNSVAGH